MGARVGSLVIGASVGSLVTGAGVGVSVTGASVGSFVIGATVGSSVTNGAGVGESVLIGSPVGVFVDATGAGVDATGAVVIGASVGGDVESTVGTGEFVAGKVTCAMTRTGLERASNRQNAIGTWHILDAAADDLLILPIFPALIFFNSAKGSDYCRAIRWTLQFKCVVRLLLIVHV
mmetsp:Transcript_31888/g.47812  ORF Transcript_31888/g.47812 Transcript_31888/m.47812 type:complete len:177 (-) Transcript_31888:35-565(-)